MEYSEWERRFDVDNEEVVRKYDAEMQELKKKHEAKRYPFQVNQISVSSIPSAPIQKAIPLQIAQKRTALKVYFKKPKSVVTKMSTFEPNRIVKV